MSHQGGLRRVARGEGAVGTWGAAVPAAGAGRGPLALSASARPRGSSRGAGAPPPAQGTPVEGHSGRSRPEARGSPGGLEGELGLLRVPFVWSTAACGERAWPEGRACISALLRPPAPARQRRGSSAEREPWCWWPAALTRGRSGSAAAPRLWTSRGGGGTPEYADRRLALLPAWWNLASRLLPPVSPCPTRRRPGHPLQPSAPGGRAASSAYGMPLSPPCL